jgi:hypothetical protein
MNATYTWTCKGQLYIITNPDWTALADAVGGVG